MEYFKQQSTSRTIGHIEIKPINNENCHEYVKELLYLPYLHNDIKEIISFLDSKIEKLEELKIKYTHNQKTEILKFLAQYPFEEIDQGEGFLSQIIKIDYAAQEITLRDFCEYTVEEIVSFPGFKSKVIDNKWKAFLNKI